MATTKFRASKFENGVVTEVTMLETREVLSMSTFLQRQAEAATLVELREAEQRSDDNVRRAAQDELARRGEALAEHRACDACGVAHTMFVYVDGRGFPCCSQACAMQIAIDRPGEHVIFSFTFSDSATRDTFAQRFLEKHADPKAWLEWHVRKLFDTSEERQTHAVLRTKPMPTAEPLKGAPGLPSRYDMSAKAIYETLLAQIGRDPWDEAPTDIQAIFCAAARASHANRPEPEPHFDFSGVMLQVVDLPPLPEGHRRVVKVTGRLGRRQFQALVERLRKDIGPAFVVLIEPGEDIEFATENPNTFTPAGIIARATEIGFKGATIVEEDQGGIVIGYDSGPDAYVERFMTEHRIAGMQYMMRKRNVASPSED